VRRGKGHDGPLRPGTILQSTRFYCLKPPPTLGVTMLESRLGGEFFNICHTVGLRLCHVQARRESATHYGKDRKLLYFWGAAASQV
jgi:hypothetical protein